MIAKADRIVIRRFVKAATTPVDGPALIDRILAALPHLQTLELQHFLEAEAERIHNRMVKRAAQQAQLERMANRLIAEFAKYPPGTTLGDLHAMAEAAKDKHGA
jgi:hypothetical protein